MSVQIFVIRQSHENCVTWPSMGSGHRHTLTYPSHRAPMLKHSLPRRNNNKIPFKELQIESGWNLSPRNRKKLAWSSSPANSPFSPFHANAIIIITPNWNFDGESANRSKSIDRNPRSIEIPLDGWIPLNRGSAAATPGAYVHNRPVNPPYWFHYDSSSLETLSPGLTLFHRGRGVGGKEGLWITVSPVRIPSLSSRQKSSNNIDSHLVHPPTHPPKRAPPSSSSSLGATKLLFAR